MSDDTPIKGKPGPKGPHTLEGPGRLASTYLPDRMHNEILRRAQQRPDGSVSGTMRDLLKQALRR
jgi:hypothetical protein